MPRIDPQQLLNCLQVLLTPQGGILSEDEVQRLANLMTKFSKKLVSKCIYVLILKNTEKPLLGLFMAEGGWNLIHIWLQDANHTKNWALVSQLLELLLIAPVDVERLKMNNLPKLVKSITKRDDLAGIQQLALSLVEEWLKIVKDVTKAEAIQQIEQQQELITNNANVQIDEPSPEVDSSANEETADNSLKYKLAIRDGKKVISKVTTASNEENVPDNNIPTSIPSDIEEEKEKKEKDEKKKEKVNHERSKHKSSSSSSSRGSSKDRKRDDSSRSRDKSRHSGDKNSSSSRDRDKKDRDKHKNNGASKHRSNSSSKSTSKEKDTKDKKETTEKQAEKDKDTLAKLAPPTLQKLGRIPKKVVDEKPKDTKDAKMVKKPTFSVEVRKDNEEKPKTVKIFNSKMRSTGLLEEAKPPPSRAAITKKPPPIVLPVLPAKRTSPMRDLIPPPEKKSRLLLDPDRPGAIKLIPPKPKPAFLQESDLFMDALTASATAKKEPKKRKRRASTSKESSSPPGSPNSNAQSSPLSSPNGSKNMTPAANFYQDTLETAESEETEVEKKMDEEKLPVPDIAPVEVEKVVEPVIETTHVDANGLRGVLSHAKRKGPKRTLRWRPEPDLVEIQYFELDETERINVMKSFGDAARSEMSGEREMLRARKLPNEDIMDVQISWRLLIEVELPSPQAEPGCKSLEKDIQFAREKRVLAALFFPNKTPDSASEPENENHPITDPLPMPLEDPDNPSQDTPTPPWTEPKGSPPHIPNMPNVFPNLSAPPFMGMGPPVGFPPIIPPFGPGFLPPMIGTTGLLANGLPPAMPPPDMMKFDPPPMFPPPDTFGPPNMENGFPPPPPFNNGPNMYPPNFNNMRGGRGFRRGGNNNMNGPWVRMSGNNNKGGGWNGRGGGGPVRGGGGRLCINFKKHGYCRNRDNCNYMH